jgi:caa(3)-type oxidase subunit IV
MAHAATEHSHHEPSNPVTKWMAAVWRSWEGLFGAIGLTGESRRVVAVFALLMVFTILTWGVYWMDTHLGQTGFRPDIFDNQVGTADLIIGLSIATAKATFVLAFFMHMIHEQRMVYRVMLFTAFFFIALLGLNTCAFLDTPPLAKPMVTENPYAVHKSHGKGHDDHGGDHAQPHGAASPAHGDYDVDTHGGHSKAQLSEEGYTEKITPGHEIDKPTDDPQPSENEPAAETPPTEESH